MGGPELTLMIIVGITAVLSFFGSLYLKNLSSSKEGENFKKSSKFKKRALPSVLFMVPLFFFVLQIITRNVQFFWIGIFSLILFFFWATMEAAKIDIKMSMKAPVAEKEEVKDEIIN